MGRRKGPSLTRDDVVEAALALVQDEGAEALGISRVASELGIKPPSVYNHVGKGDALARAVVIEGTRRMLLVLEDAVRGVIDPRDQLRALADAIRRWVKDNGGLYTLMSRVEPDNDHPEFAPVARRLLDVFARPLGQLGVTGSDTIHAIRSLRAAMHGFVLLETSGQFQLEQDPGQSYRWLVEALLRGIAAQK